MKQVDKTETRIAAAETLRRTLAVLFGVGSAKQIIFCPGILVGLQILFANLGLRRLGLTQFEYYGNEHFPAQDTAILGLDGFSNSLRKFRADVVLVSAVSWRGDVTPIREIFRDLRAEFGSACPLLVADCTHAGAIGFPSLRSFGADVVCGDASKWIAPVDHESKLAFMWAESREIQSAARSGFRSLFLATNQTRSDQRSARWVDPVEVQWLSDWLKDAHITRRVLQSAHRRNMKLAKHLAKHFGVDAPPTSAILWVERWTECSMVDALSDAAVAWAIADGGLRILCRAEAVSEICLDTDFLASG